MIDGEPIRLQSCLMGLKIEFELTSSSLLTSGPISLLCAQQMPIHPADVTPGEVLRAWIEGGFRIPLALLKFSANSKLLGDPVNFKDRIQKKIYSFFGAKDASTAMQTLKTHGFEAKPSATS
ncbi:hypothetical protein SAY86_021708 [Trapa natans]|uniref:Uncharacterized protein n=1 Tax=Trapa natans TaxID=22666 RepID=A0AAN7MCW3_TRANT|nr:hypothetical protein SAY86_021708 [Trapa natans]